MRDTPVHIANERVKVLSGILVNLGAVLLAASGAQVYTYGEVRWDPIWWTGIAAILIFMGLKVLALLQIEDRT